MAEAPLHPAQRPSPTEASDESVIVAHVRTLISRLSGLAEAGTSHGVTVSPATPPDPRRTYAGGGKAFKLELPHDVNVDFTTNANHPLDDNTAPASAIFKFPPDGQLSADISESDNAFAAILRSGGLSAVSVRNYISGSECEDVTATPTKDGLFRRKAGYTIDASVPVSVRHHDEERTPGAGIILPWYGLDIGSVSSMGGSELTLRARRAIVEALVDIVPNPDLIRELCADIDEIHLHSDQTDLSGDEVAKLEEDTIKLIFAIADLLDPKWEEAVPLGEKGRSVFISDRDLKLAQAIAAHLYGLEPDYIRRQYIDKLAKVNPLARRLEDIAVQIEEAYDQALLCHRAAESGGVDGT